MTQFVVQVRFESIGGLSRHISALKEMVVFPLLYPEVFERFKIQPPRYSNQCEKITCGSGWIVMAVKLL